MGSSGECRERRRSRSPQRPRKHSNPNRKERDEGRRERSYGTEKKRGKNEMDTEENLERQKPNFECTGKLLEETNIFNGVIIKYSEPEDARKPKIHWRFYVFKGEETLPILHLHRQSAFLMGRDRKIADIPIDHPSCSKQHAVFQFRFKGGEIIPYIIDLESSNGTYLNNQRIDPKRYYELKEKDMVKFGFSSREYVLLHDESTD
ncbi:smad nuclear-interacting protein 1-like [Lepeophtheirus salmonis]|uniref:smad nuclear-interacting protein 1-like n=1 Tax=Lepeophtheirus salmonis TaxID=72036 RepID=UPI001AE71497|nr:smad nuclear interacting protein 1-like [Lepeophtheirus salmonis]XP_040580351.1 smad nuclear interacting protein 1-like [Lepeophtheirus salmonis]